MIACKKSLLCFKIFSMICQNRKNVTCIFLAQILRADFVICTKSYIKIITARKLMIQHGIIYRNCEVCLYQATFFEKNDSEYLWNVHAINCNLNLTNRSANCVAYICTYKYRQYYNFCISIMCLLLSHLMRTTECQKYRQKQIIYGEISQYRFINFLVATPILKYSTC